MVNSLSSFADNVAEGRQNSKYKSCRYCLGYTKVRYKLSKFMCLKCDKKHYNISKKIKSKYLQTCINFVMETLITFV